MSMTGRIIMSMRDERIRCRGLTCDGENCTMQGIAVHVKGLI
ncbi:MAG: hypothetical protein ACMUJM_19525 [bacterium]